MWVPQRSRLGTLLFLVHVNSLHLVLKCREVNMYADDTNICFLSGSVADINMAIYTDPKDLKIWLESNRLPLDALKAQRMCIGTCRQLQELEQNTSIELSLKIGIIQRN